MDSDEGKKQKIAADMDELAYTELTLSIDDKTRVTERWSSI
jgi:hypothetical protein